MCSLVRLFPSEGCVRVDWYRTMTAILLRRERGRNNAEQFSLLRPPPPPPLQREVTFQKGGRGTTREYGTDILQYPNKINVPGFSQMALIIKGQEAKWSNPKSSIVKCNSTYRKGKCEQKCKSSAASKTHKSIPKLICGNGLFMGYIRLLCFEFSALLRNRTLQDSIHTDRP